MRLTPSILNHNTATTATYVASSVGVGIWSRPTRTTSHPGVPPATGNCSATRSRSAAARTIGTWRPTGTSGQPPSPAVRYSVADSRVRRQQRSHLCGPRDVSRTPGFNDTRRFEVHGTTVYVSGYGPGAAFEAGPDDWKFSGKRIARFNQLPTASGWGTAAWAIQVPWARARTGRCPSAPTETSWRSPTFVGPPSTKATSACSTLTRG